MSFNINNLTHISELNVELTTDPNTLGYNGSIIDGDDSGDADIINLPRLANQRDNLVSAVDIEEVVDPADYPNAGADQFKRDMWRDLLLAIGSEGQVNANGSKLKDKVLLVFPAGVTRTNLAALQTRDGSRAEVIWGDGSNVTPKAIAIALRGA